MRERPVDATEDAINLKFLTAFKSAGEGGTKGGYKAKKTSRSPIIVRKSATAAQMGAKGAA
jgi:hypothetical protein